MKNHKNKSHILRKFVMRKFFRGRGEVCSIGIWGMGPLTETPVRFFHSAVENRIYFMLLLYSAHASILRFIRFYLLGVLRWFY